MTYIFSANVVVYVLEKFRDGIAWQGIIFLIQEIWYKFKLEIFLRPSPFVRSHIFSSTFWLFDTVAKTSVLCHGWAVSLTAEKRRVNPR